MFTSALSKAQNFFSFSKQIAQAKNINVLSASKILIEEPKVVVNDENDCFIFATIVISTQILASLQNNSNEIVSDAVFWSGLKIFSNSLTTKIKSEKIACSELGSLLFKASQNNAEQINALVELFISKDEQQRLHRLRLRNFRARHRKLARRIH